MDSFENIVLGLSTDGDGGLEWKVVVVGLTISSLGLIFADCLLSWSLLVEEEAATFLVLLLLIVLLVVVFLFFPSTCGVAVS